MTTHCWLDKSSVGRIGIWEIDEQIIGVATFDCQLGTAYCLALPEYAFLKKEMLLYAKDNLKKDGDFGTERKRCNFLFRQNIHNISLTRGISCYYYGRKLWCISILACFMEMI